MLEGVDLNREYLNTKALEALHISIGSVAKLPSIFASVSTKTGNPMDFYVYELNPDGKPSLADHIVAQVRRGLSHRSLRNY